MSRAARLLLIFESIHQVLAAEKALIEAGLSPDLVPVPREVNPNCGMAITLAPAERGRALLALARTPPARTIEPWRA
ncbi:MAG: DUF3343 domain-containing protein [Planctomycetes bacterium]|nr:DUF3343 domain-containing protein [Planctomycetota bacterium]